MRLYSLVSRHGRVKRGFFPWFAPPDPGATMRYHGWRWDPEKREWVQTEVHSISLSYTVEPEPKPTEPPRPFQTDEVEGWEWSEIYEVWEEREMPKIEKWHYPGELPWPRKPTWMPSRTLPAEVKGWKYIFERAIWEKVAYCDVYQEFRPPQPKYPPGPAEETEVLGWSWSWHYKEWLKVMYAEEIVEATPPRTLPPGLTVEALIADDPYFIQEMAAATALARAGNWSALQSGNAFFKLVADVHFKFPHVTDPANIADDIFRAREVMRAKSVWLASEEAWRMRINALAPSLASQILSKGFVPVLMLIFACVGYLIGMFWERALLAHEYDIVHRDKRGAYLFGGDEWSYAGIRAQTKKGVQYYSGCGSIGTRYVRHKRGYGVGQIDTIDFPGGFVEEGWRWGKFVKYTWSYWELEYVGFLTHSTTDLYRLQGSEDPDFLPEYSFILNDDEVCRNFQEEYL